MTRFKDSKGREWSLSLSVGMVEKVKEDADFDMDELLQKPEAVALVLMRSPKVLAQVLWVMIEDQAKSLGVEPRDFGFSLDRESLDRGADALMEEWILFYPRSSAGKAIAGRWPELRTKMDTDIEREVSAALAKELSGTATGSLGSSAPIPPG